MHHFVSQTPRKGVSNDRLASSRRELINRMAATTVPSAAKEENKVRTSMKKVSGNGGVSVNKPRDFGRTQLGGEANHGLPSHFVKFPVSSLQLRDGSISWSALPSSLAKLGKVCNLLYQRFKYFKLFFLKIIFCESFFL